MKTFDLFHTLVASRHDMKAGEVDVESHIPIAENIAKVNPEDVIVSDYHTADKAERILRQVCKLPNTLLCTEDGKATGRVWSMVKSERHLGDNVHTDFNSPRQHGIKAELTTLYQLTDREKACGRLGYAMREARLATWSYDTTIRALQLHQIENNFPFLYLVARLLRDKMVELGTDRLLLCSRDCYLLHKLMPEAEYFYTSRLTRYRPSEHYAHYAKERLSGNTLIVDMNGSGNSLKHLTDAFGGTPLLVVGTTNTVPHLVFGGIRETSNQAPHPMVYDVTVDEEGEWEPVYANPTKQDWQKPEITEAHKAFDACIAAIAHHPADYLPYSLVDVLKVMDNYALSALWADHLDDSIAAYELLNSGELPHPVIL
jgi:hypothetical protein